MKEREEVFVDLIAEALEALHIATGTAGNEEIIVDLVNGLSKLSGNTNPMLTIEVDEEEGLDIDLLDTTYEDQLLDEEVHADVENSLDSIMDTVDMLLDDRAELMQKNLRLVNKIKYLEGEQKPW